MCRPFYSFILSPFLFPCRTSSGRPHRKTQKQDCYLSSLCLPSLFTFVGPLFSLVFSQEQAKKASRQFLCARLFERSYRGRQRKARATRPARHSRRGRFCRYRLKVLLFFVPCFFVPRCPSRPSPTLPFSLCASRGFISCNDDRVYCLTQPQVNECFASRRLFWATNYFGACL